MRENERSFIMKDETLADILAKVASKWGQCNFEKILIEPISEPTLGCGHHPSDYESFLMVSNTEADSALNEIQRGLQAYWTEDNAKIEKSDIPAIVEEAGRLLHERGLGAYCNAIYAIVHDNEVFLCWKAP